MLGRVPPLRALAVLAGAALVLHQLRWMVAPDPHAAAAGHAYLAVVAPVVAALLALACGGFVLALSRARRGSPAAAQVPRLGRLWAGASAVLAVTYSAQELAEATLVGGHAAGLGALVGHGGWIAYVLAIALGALVALLLRGASAAIARAAAKALPQRRGAPPPARRPEPVLTSPSDALANHLAGRAPPLVLPSQ